MPITINGSGSVAGLSAGGLPDNCITTAEIAANAVTTAKLGTNEASGLCKAWVNFNGTGTVAIRASYNVSSITDNGTGDYTVNFTTAMADANYSVVGSISISYPGAASYNTLVPNITAVNTTTAARIGTGFTTTPTDMALVCVAIFR
jgi:hypothetical protein